LLCDCRFESALNRFGDQLLEQMDNTPVELVEVRNTVEIPDGLPSSEELQVPVQPLQTPPADYPERLRKKSVEGKATVLFVVDSTGALLNPQIEYATDTSFAQSLLKAVQSWRVAPGQDDGRPVSCYKRLTIDFALK
jgi:TonB family protein